MKKIMIASLFACLSTHAFAESTLNTPLQGKQLHGIMQNDYEPLVFVDDKGENSGYFYELVAAAAKKLGANLSIANGTFDTFIPGLQSQRFDLALGTDATVARQQVVDIIPLIDAGYSFITQTKSTVHLGKQMDALCGHSVAALAGQSTLDALNEQAAQCEKQGKPALRVAIFPSRSAAWLAVKSGQAELTPVYTGEAGWITKKDPDWRVTGPVFNSGESGFSVNKESGNAKAWAAAINALIADGSYQAILKKYGVQNVGLKKVVINPAT
ncbi:transporter substrate-binding domain-containing protein [Pantoea sp. App145]|uniref:transporter substrate-binding domain-containing protein n=1 Tax=Pantoea sp. App145 TaxID=3071567 RepID=UPI003A80265F